MNASSDMLCITGSDASRSENVVSQLILGRKANVFCSLEYLIQSCCMANRQCQAMLPRAASWNRDVDNFAFLVAVALGNSCVRQSKQA